MNVATATSKVFAVASSTQRPMLKGFSLVCSKVSISSNCMRELLNSLSHRSYASLEREARKSNFLTTVLRLMRSIRAIRLWLRAET